MLTWWRCDAEGIRPGEKSVDFATVPDSLPPGGFAWVELTEPDASELERLVTVLRLPPFVIHDAISAHRRPRLDAYGDVMSMVVKSVWYLDGTSDVETGDVTFLLNRWLLVTVRHGDGDPMPDARARLEHNPKLLRLGTRGAAYAVVGTMVDTYLKVSEEIETDVTQLERAVFSPGRVNRVEQLYSLQREVLEFREAVQPMDVIADELLSHHDRRDAVTPFVRTLAHRVKRVGDSAARSENLLNAILQAHLGQIGMWQNEDMRKISAWAAIIAAPTMIAGIYGMNFKHMPELNWVVSYPAVLVLMAVICWLLHRGFKRNGWL